MNNYFERYAYPGKLFTDVPNNSLKISVVIPCHAEPDIITTLNSLNNCHPVQYTEVIIIVNEAENCTEVIRQQNKTTLKEIDSWKAQNKINFALLTYYLVAPDKDAGVGLARKVGMDEAARRFELIKNRKGVICCFDADSTCSPNYFDAVYQHFYKAKSRPNAAIVYFEHPLPNDSLMKEGIIQYELHLRYYVHALRLIGYPFAHQTVGSSIIVRSDIYQKVGGMNKRKAGEDFYFLHRVMPTGNFIDIINATIYPSARISKRVPFGTGKAMDKWHKERPPAYDSYNLKAFLDLKCLFDKTALFFKINDSELKSLLASLPQSVRAYLDHIAFTEINIRLNGQSRNLSTFINNWYQYFDGFKVLKYLHFARDNYYANMPVTSEAAQLAHSLWPKEIRKLTTAKEYLYFYRKIDRSN